MHRIAKLTGDAVMLAGIGGALAGLYMLAGLGWLLLVGGIVIGLGGFLLDVGWFSRER